jgi:hypothetical protein
MIEEETMFAAVESIESTISSHHRPRGSRTSDSKLKGAKIDLAEGADGNLG